MSPVAGLDRDEVGVAGRSAKFVTLFQVLPPSIVFRSVLSSARPEHALLDGGDREIGDRSGKVGRRHPPASDLEFLQWASESAAARRRTVPAADPSA